MSCKNKVSQGSKNTLQKEFEMVKTGDLTDFFPKRKKTSLGIWWTTRNCYVCERNVLTSMW